MLEHFPAEELARMIEHIDRFDTEVVTKKKLDAEKAIEKAIEVSEKIIEENQ